MKVLNQEVDMICWFDRQGVPTPIKLKVTDEYEHEQIIKIQAINKRDFERLAGNRMYVYTCQYEIQGELRGITLKYELDTCRWFIYKI